MIKIVRRPGDTEDVIVTYDITLERVGLEFTVSSTNPHGFFRFSTAKGKVPANLQGDFTSFEQARRAVIAFEAQAEKPKEVIPPKTSAIPK